MTEFQPPLLYVYAIADRPLAMTCGGIDLAPVEWISEAGLSAAVSRVPAEDFEEGPLNHNIADMGWLGPRAVAHQEVNYRLHGALEATIPLSFGTVFRDEARVREFLLLERAALKARLDCVRAASEWVLGVHQLTAIPLEDVENLSPKLQTGRAEVEAAPPGRAHLLRRRLADLEKDERRRLEAETANQVLARLQHVTRGVFAEPLPRDTADRPLLRASLLVARADEDAFLDEVERLRVRWREPVYSIALTGPWPPYRFGGIEPAATTGASA